MCPVSCCQCTVLFSEDFSQRDIWFDGTWKPERGSMWDLSGFMQAWNCAWMDGKPCTNFSLWKRPFCSRLTIVRPRSFLTADQKTNHMEEISLYFLLTFLLKEDSNVFSNIIIPWLGGWKCVSKWISSFDDVHMHGKNPLMMLIWCWLD